VRRQLNLNRWIILILIGIVLALPIVYGVWNQTEVNRCVQASQARFDLSACDFQRHKGFSLNGEWQFHWQQLANRGLAEPTALINVPSQWYNAYSLLAEQYPAQGYGRCL
jgi:hypothetical protein